MRVLFLGHQLIGQRCLSALLKAGADVGLVVGHDGGESLAPMASAHGIPFQSADKAPASWDWQGEGPDWIVSVYFRYLISESLLAAPFGAMNVHCSLLPAYRGCAPVNWALLCGEKQVGVTLHEMVATADAGAIIEQVSYDVGPNQNAGEVMEHLSKVAADILVRQFASVLSGNVQRTPQPRGDFPIYRRRTPKDGVIDWFWPAEQIHNLVRAVSPASLYGGAFTPDGVLITSSRLPDGAIPPLYTRMSCGSKLTESIDVVLCSKTPQ